MKIERLTEDHVSRFRMSQRNLEEFKTIYEADPTVSLHRLVGNEYAFAFLSNDNVVCISGVMNVNGKNGDMYALFSEDIKGSFVKFARASEFVVQSFVDEFPNLVCTVWAKNGGIIQWLVFLGFRPFAELRLGSETVIKFARSCPVMNFPVSERERPAVH